MADSVSCRSIRNAPQFGFFIGGGTRLSSFGADLLAGLHSLVFILVGMPLLMGSGLGSLALVIIAVVNAANVLGYRYPLLLRGADKFTKHRLKAPGGNWDVLRYEAIFIEVAPREDRLITSMKWAADLVHDSHEEHQTMDSSGGDSGRSDQW